MRRLKRRILSMLMAALLVLSLTGNVVSAQPEGEVVSRSVGTDIREIFAGKIGTRNTDFIAQNDKSKDYKEHEALVMAYVDDTATVENSNQVFQARKNSKGEFSASKFVLAGDIVTIKTTYEFENKDTVQKSISSAQLAPATTAAKKLQVSHLVSEDLSTEALIKAVKEQYTNIVIAQPNYAVKERGADDNYKQYQWALDNQGQNKGTVDKDVNPEAAWEAAKSDEKVIAIIDTGIDYTHEALQGRMWENKTGVLSGTCGYDFFNGDADPLDDNGHGTHCAGIIAGNGTGVTGVAKNVKLMALKFLDSYGGGFDSDAVAAYDYINRAINCGVNVVAINCSWGGGEGSDIFEKLVNLVGKKGAITVNAAGNIASNNDIEPNHPWAFTSDYMISVAASTEKGELAAFSNYGVNSVDLAAPGTDILSSVSYNAYNPTIHSGETQANYSEKFNDFSGSDLPVGHKEFSIDYESMEPTTAPTLTFDKNDSFGLGNDTSGSLSLLVNSDKDEIFGCYWPITLPESSTDYYLSAMVKDRLLSADYEGSGGQVYYGVELASKFDALYNNTGDMEQIVSSLSAVGMDYSMPNSNFWSMVSGNTEIKKSEEGKYVFYIIGISWGQSTSEINIDNIGVSKQNMVPDDFGKYDFYNGTSMAAPHVTASVALLRQCNPEITTEALRDKVVTCARSEEKLEGATKEKRNLDLSNYNKNTMVIKSISYSNGKIILKGNSLSEVAAIQINGNPAAFTCTKDTELSVTASNCANKKVSFVFTFKDGTTTTRTEYISYNTVEVSTITDVNDVEKGSIVSDGSTIYNYGENGFGSYKLTDGYGEWTENEIVTNKVVDAEVVETLGSEPASIKSNIFYNKHNIYALAQNTIGYATTIALVVYDTANGNWSKLCDVPAKYNMSNVVGTSLAVYNGKIYLMGGMNEKSLEVLNTVYSYDINKNTWLQEANLLEGRAFAKVNVVKGKLILTFGTVDGQSSLSDTAPAPLLMTSQGWSQSTAKCKATANRIEYMGMKPYSYYDASVGTSTKGLVFAGLVTEDFGDVFYYNVDKDSYETASNCSLYEYTKVPEFYGGTSVADQFCFLGKGEKSLKYDEWGEPYYTYSNKLYSIPMETGYYNVVGDNTFCQYSGAGYYLPGESAKISIMPMDGYTVSGYLLNGVEYEGTTVTIDKIDKNYTIEPIGKPLAIGIVFSQSEYEVIAGNTLTIDAQLLPMGAQDEIFWEVDSDDSSITNGVLKTSFKDAGRLLTVIAYTESGAISICKVKVISVAQSIRLNKQKIALQQGDSFSIVATVSPANPINGLLRYKSSNPSVAMVNDSGDLVGLKPGKAIITISTVATKNVKPVQIQCQVTVVARVSQVTKLKATAASNQIKLSWNKVNSADGYIVYRYDSKTKKDVQIAVVYGGQKTSYTVKQLLGSKGAKLAAGTAYVFRVLAFDKVEGTLLYGPKASISTFTTPNASSIKGVKNSKKGQLKVTWSKASGITGYQIYMSDKGNGRYLLKATIKKAGTDSVTLKGLKKGTWYVKVRTYKVINGRIIYSNYSVYKKVKIKK